MSPSPVIIIVGRCTAFRSESLNQQRDRSCRGNRASSSRQPSDRLAVRTPRHPQRFPLRSHALGESRIVSRTTTSSSTTNTVIADRSTGDASTAGLRAADSRRKAVRCPRSPSGDGDIAQPAGDESRRSRLHQKPIRRRTRQHHALSRSRQRQDRTYGDAEQAVSLVKPTRTTQIMDLAGWTSQQNIYADLGISQHRGQSSGEYEEAVVRLIKQ